MIENTNQNCQVNLQLLSSMTVPTIALSSHVPPLALSRMPLERHLPTESRRIRAPPDIKLWLHSQTMHNNPRRGHNTIAMALGIDLFRRVLEFNLPDFNPPRPTVFATFASSALSSGFYNLCNCGPAVMSKISGILYLSTLDIAVLTNR